jgi:hypothetical protein
MAGLSASVENSLLLLIFNATTWANYAVNATASPETTMTWTLNTADPTSAGAANASEIAYGSYARVTTNRASGAGGMTVTTNSCSPQANVSFPQSSAGTGTATNFTCGKSGGGASIPVYYGTVTPSILVNSTGITPILTTATAMTLT